MQNTTGSVPDVESRGRECAALSDSGRSPLVTSQPTSQPAPPYPNPFPRCIDPHCPCAACLHRSTLLALAGGIPTNAEWWKVQGVFPVTDGGVAGQVDGFFAQEVR